MKDSQEIIAYIDGANLYNGVRGQGWKLDYIRFRVWLREKLGVTKVYLFIGLDANNRGLYTFLQDAGYILIFKPTIVDNEGKLKGNCDADMVLNIIVDLFENKFDQAILITSDGDFYSTVQYLQERGKLSRLLSPSNRCSKLLRQTGAKITYLQDLRGLLEYHKRKLPPRKTKHPKE